MRQLLPWVLLALSAASCSIAPTQSIPLQQVRAVAETVVTTDPAVDADDPVLWADERDPSRALLFGTDKTDGLYVHNLDGSVRQFLPDGPLNNVDLRTNFMVGGLPMVLIAASDRAKFGVRTYLLDPQTLSVSPYGLIATDIGEPYGFCMGRHGDDVYAVVNNKDGVIVQIRIEAGEGGARGTVVRRLKLATQLEGCVVDDESQQLYVGEEDVGVWRFAFDPAASGEATSVARVDQARLTADVEGLVVMRDGPHKYLVVSSQGDNTYAVYRIESTEPVFAGRFAVVDGATIDRVSGTDGLTAWSGPIAGYPQGLLAMHDEDDAPHRGQQNFKLVDWRDVKQALELP